MATNIRKNAEVTVTLNGEAANNMLKQMAERAKAVAGQIRETAKKGTEATEEERKQLAVLQKEHKALESAQKNVTKATYDYSQVLKNLNGSTLRELEKAKKALRAQLQHLTPETQQYIEKTKQLQQVDTRIRQLNAGMREQRTAWQNITAAAAKFFPVAALGAGVVTAVKKIGTAIFDTFKSVQATGDAWVVMVAGMNAGWDYFKRSLVTSDWSNFFSNMDRAIEAGREYARIMDELGERNRSYRIIESETRQEIAEMNIQLKNVNLSNKERIAIADQIIDKEDALLAHRKSMAVDEFDAITNTVAANTTLDKEKLKSFMREYEQNKMLIAQADEYIKNVKEYKRYSEGVAANYGGTEQPEAKRLYQEINNASEAVKIYAAIKQKYDKSTDEELEKMVKAWVELNNVFTDYYNNIQTAETRKNRLLKKDTDETSDEKKLKKQRESLKILEDEQAEAHQRRLENIKKARTEENLTEAEYNLKAAQEDVLYYKERETALQNFLKTVTNNALRADVEKKIAEGRNKQLDADRKADQELLAVYKEGRDKQLKIAQNSYDTQVVTLKKSLAEGKITEEQYDLMLLAIESETAGSRLKIQQDYQEDIAALELQSGDLKEKAVEEANAAVLAAEKDAADKQFAMVKQLAESERDFKKQFSLLTVEDEKNIQLGVLEKNYQARKEFLEKEGLDTAALTKAYELAKTNIVLDAEENRFALRQQLGLANWQEEYDMEMKQLQNMLDNKAITEEEYEESKLKGRILHLKKYIDYYTKVTI
jgi:hypothetical protein